jgi:hypothetical protein
MTAVCGGATRGPSRRQDVNGAYGPAIAAVFVVLRRQNVPDRDTESGAGEAATRLKGSDCRSVTRSRLCGGGLERFIRAEKNASSAPAAAPSGMLPMHETRQRGAELRLMRDSS